MATRTKKTRAPKARPVQTPKRRQQASRPLSRLLVGAGAGALVVVAVIAVVLLRDGGGNGATSVPAQGLPSTPDYHSLSVSRTRPNEILLGTHQGLYRSGDRGKTWQFQALPDQDAMNLARPGGSTVWTAGHDVLAKSTDGGQSWTNVSPAGLPSLDVHGFAVDPRNPRTLYAAIAGQGLYRSTNSGASFRLVSPTVGGAVMALALTPAGDILAGDMEQGLLLSRDGGKRWRLLLRAQLMGLAINPAEPKRILAAGPGVLLSTDGGRRWRQALKIEQGAGPVAWSQSEPMTAYVVGFDRRLYRSTDGGETWSSVG